LVELIAEGGCRSATVRRVTKLAGVSTGSFYVHFEGTDACFLATYSDLMGEVHRRIVASRSPELRGPDQVAIASRALLEALLEDRDAARVTLVQAFGAAPGALSPVRAYEARLESALRESLNRREQRVSATTTAWIVAGAVHCARLQVISGFRWDTAELSDLVAGWAEDLVACVRTVRPRREVASRRRLNSEVRLGSGSEETELSLSALIKLAIAGGYWRLTPARVSKATGIPATRVRRHFPDPEAGYMAAVDRTAQWLFSDIPFANRGEGSTALTDWVLRVAARSADKPGNARLALSGILEPGLSGLTRRQALIRELASSWQEHLPPGERPDPLLMEATIASLWEALAKTVDSGSHEQMPNTAATFAALAVSSLGSKGEVSGHRRDKKQIHSDS
jgi:AcrR family transcriptional regulator